MVRPGWVQDAVEVVQMMRYVLLGAALNGGDRGTDVCDLYDKVLCFEGRDTGMGIGSPWLHLSQSHLISSPFGWLLQFYKPGIKCGTLALWDF